MSNIIPISNAKAEVLNEATFDGLENDQLAYKIWTSVDTVFELLGGFDLAPLSEIESNLNELQFELIRARFALMVLVRRQCGRSPQEIDETLMARWRKEHGLDQEVPQ